MRIVSAVISSSTGARYRISVDCEGNSQWEMSGAVGWSVANSAPLDVIYQAASLGSVSAGLIDCPVNI